MSDGSLARGYTASSERDDEILQQALEFTRHTPPAYTQKARKLSGPVAVPQASKGPGMPFTRAYAPILAEHGVTMEEFVEFIDNLNVVSSSSPPLQVLDLAGGIAGFVPIHYAQFISMGIQAVAKIGNAAVMRTRGTVFMKKVNAEYFNPRGLRVELATGEALKARVGINPSASLAAPISESDDLCEIDRTLAGVQGYVAPLTFNVPPPNEPTNILNKLFAKQQATILRKQEKKIQKPRNKYVEKSANIDEDISKEALKLEKELIKLDRERQKEEKKRDAELRKLYAKDKEGRKRAREEAKIAKDFDKEMTKLEREYGKAQDEYDKEVRKSEKDRLKEDKEGSNAEKGLWILVESL